MIQVYIYISFPSQLWQITTNLVAENNIHFLSYSSGGQKSKVSAMDWIVSPANSYVGAPNPSEGGAFGSYLRVTSGHEGGALLLGISALLWKDARELLLSLRHAKTQWEGCHLQDKKSPEPNHAGPLILDFQPPELGEKRCLSHQLPSPWYFVTAAQAG